MSKTVPTKKIQCLLNDNININIGCSFKFILKVGVEESIVNTLLISLQSKNTTQKM
jgi:hypothetical protein